MGWRIAGTDDANFVLALSLGWLLSLSGLAPLAAVTARALGRISHGLLRRRVRLARDGIERCFPGRYDTGAKDALIRDSFTQYWLDTFSLCGAIDETAIDVVGLEHWRAARDGGEAVLFWESGFFGRRYLGMRIRHSRDIVVQQVHAMTHFGKDRTWIRETVTRPFLQRLERRYVGGIILIDEAAGLRHARRVVEALEARRPVTISGDGLAGKGTVTVPFLGHQARFPTGVLSAARLTGARILPTFCHRRRDGSHRLVIHPPLAADGADRNRATMRAAANLAALLERYVKEFPDQYRRWHNIENGTVDGRP